MFDWLKRLAGEGKIRTSVTFTNGQSATVKVPYIGDINTLDMGELKIYIRKFCFVEYGLRVDTITIDGYY